MTEPTKRPTRSAAERELDATLMDSFPASDPPALSPAVRIGCPRRGDAADAVPADPAALPRQDHAQTGRGFVGIDPARQSEIAREGARVVPNATREVSEDHLLARSPPCPQAMTAA